MERTPRIPVRDRVYTKVALESVLTEIGAFAEQGGVQARAGQSLVAQLSNLGVGSVIKEDHYIDRDYIRAYDVFYSTLFRPPEKFTTRYHFFKEVLPAAFLRSELAKFTYLGFVVIWPTDPPVIGRTAIEPPLDLRDWVLSAPVVAHIGHQELSVEAVPYATKDFGVSACATVATWLATETAAALHGLGKTTSTDITLAAGPVTELGRVLPQRFGLTPLQIARALSQCGYDPFIYDPAVGTNWDLDQILLDYALSDLPTILMVEIGSARHALTVVGVVLDAGKFEAALRGAEEPEGRKPAVPRSLACGVTEVVVHDDRNGPYLRLRSAGSPIQKIIDYGIELDGQEGTLDRCQTITISQVIVPFPPHVYNVSTDAQLFAGSLVERMAKDTDWGTKPYALQTYLIDSTRAKKESLYWRQRGVAHHFRHQSLPRRMWLTEAQVPPLSSGRGEVLARVVSDASVLRDAKQRPYLWAHVDDQVWPVGALRSQSSAGVTA